MTQNIGTAEAIKDAVRDHYGQIAQSKAGSDCCGDTSACCADSASAGQSVYSAEELDLVPAEAATTSLGCGNPTALASLRPGEVVLDLGSGAGLDVLLAAQRVGPAGFVYGLDMTDQMLELSRRNAEKVGATNVEFLKGDIEEIPLPDASVDVIISNCVINLTTDKRRALREAFRVLRPGGRLAISDIVIDGSLEGLPVSEAQIRAALSWTGCIAGALTMDEYREYLAEAGFEEINVEVEHRHSAAAVLPNVPDALADLSVRALQDLIGRFTSSAVTARRPLA